MAISKLKKLMLATGVTLALGAPVAHADPVTFLPAGADVQFKYNNFEAPFVTNVGDLLFGIVNVSTIGDLLANPYWASGISDGTQLTGEFGGLTAAQILPAGGGGFNIWFTGGTLSLYNVPTGTYAPTSPLNPIAGQICPAGVCPAPWLTADFTPGIVPVDDPTTVGFDESTTTLFSTVTLLVAPLTGTGDGLLELTGGTAAFKFLDGPGPDFSIQSGLESCPPGAGPTNCVPGVLWPLASFDPVTGKTVPEPGTLLLLGVALAGLGAARRWRTGR